MNCFRAAALAASLIHAGTCLAQQGAIGRITQLYVPREGTYARVQLDTATINPGNCAASEYYIVEFPASGSKGPMLSAQYLAYAQRQPVTMWIYVCTDSAYWGSVRPSARDIYLSAP